MLRWAAMAALLLGMSACANQALPPGGPPDVDPPVILKITPENNTVGAKAKTVELRFNEVISETPSGSGARDLRDLVFISPKSGKAEVSWGRSRIAIRPSKGWKPNTVYSIQIKPGLQDLRNNKIDSTIRVVFSTGGAIPDTRLEGVAFDWPAGKGMSEAVIEAMAPDSTTYQAVADSAGRFQLRYLPPGPYLVRAYADRNNSRELEPLELWDSTRVTLAQSARTELYAFGHDTVGLRIQEIAVEDSNRVVKVTFDKPYSPEQFFVREGSVIKRADSSVVPVKLVQSSAQKRLTDSLRTKAKADSAAREAAAKLPKVDSTPAMRARADSLMRVKRADSVAAAEKARRDAQREAARARGGRAVPLDTTPPPKMSRPLIYNEMFITLESALAPGAQYRLQMSGIRSLSNVVKSPTRTFSTPKEKKDTTSAKKDTATVKRDTAAVKKDTTAKR